MSANTMPGEELTDDFAKRFWNSTFRRKCLTLHDSAYVDKLLEKNIMILREENARLKEALERRDN